jgi:hypothetical protein
MAMNERVEGKTIFGSPHASNCTVGVNTREGTASFVSLLDSKGQEWFLWFDTSGNLRRATALPADPDVNGTVVGP